MAAGAAGRYVHGAAVSASSAWLWLNSCLPLHVDHSMGSETCNKKKTFAVQGNMQVESATVGN